MESHFFDYAGKGCREIDSLMVSDFEKFTRHICHATDDRDIPGLPLAAVITPQRRFARAPQDFPQKSLAGREEVFKPHAVTAPRSATSGLDLR